MRILLLLGCIATLSAALGPESTAVVINGDHAGGVAVAQAWMRLRKIPEQHAITLRDIPEGHQMDLAAFRSRILDAVEGELRQRGIAERIALIAYAPGFPTAIRFTPADPHERWQKSPGSLTGMTLLAPLLAGPSTEFTARRANPYAERIAIPGQELDAQASADPRSREAIKALEEKRLDEALTVFSAIATDIAAPSILYNLACLQALQGDAVVAMDSLDRAITAGWWNADHTRDDADLASLHALPQWPQALERVASNAQQIQPGESLPFTVLPAVAGSPPGRLAMLLAPLGGRGLEQAEEANEFLARSVAADGSRPRGTVYFMITKDRARSGPRQWAFPAAAAALAASGVQTEILRGVLPPRDAQVIGMMTGVATFDWAASGAQMLPGAWCDHLTSFGGALQAGASQTPLTAFLRAGAAGTGGAVSEPLNLWEKFPHAFLHVHRARGLSLVEAIHRTMACPYQYLAVGDPLSRPW